MKTGLHQRSYRITKAIRFYLAGLVCLISVSGIHGQSNPHQWFSDAKLGIFIHWGIYAVNGTSESWSFHNRETTYQEYMSQMKGFTASSYNPQAWANLISESGARYAVITTKHHDGFSLYDTRYTTPSSIKGLWKENKPLSAVYQSPAGRDLITPFAEAIRKKGIRFGAYYSLLDWSHNDYTGFYKDSSRYKLSDDTARWNRFIRFMHGQVEEINTRFKPDIFWFDGDWEHSEEEWQAADLNQLIRAGNPGVMLNGRLKSYGDYQTPEQNMPVARPEKSLWELCMTTNNNWGYRPADTAWKTPYEIISVFTEVLGMGGNMLLDIGPRQDGTIPEEQEHILKELGAWIRRNEPAVYSSKQGLPYGHYHGSSVLSADSMTVFLFLPSVKNSPQGSASLTVMLKGLRSEIKRCTVLGSEREIKPKIVGKISWSQVPGTVYMEVPVNAMDPYITVIRIDLKNTLELYRGQGGFQ